MKRREPWDRWDARLFAWCLRMGWRMFRLLMREQPPSWSPYWSQRLPDHMDGMPVDYEEPGFRWVL